MIDVLWPAVAWNDIAVKTCQKQAYVCTADANGVQVACFD